MSTAKHTAQGIPPAPYTFTPREVGGLGIVQDANGKPILDLLAQQEPLGHLIAAAPELLEALKRVRHAFYVDGSSKALRAAFEGTKELVAKSEGRA